MTKPRQQLLSKPSQLLSEETLSDIKTQASKERGELKSDQTFKGEDPGNIKDGNATPSDFLKSINFTPQPNPLSDLFQPTYHFQFFLASDDPEIKDPNSIFVIAETGLTGMNLQDVTIESFVGPNVRTKNATATNITIKIYEPMGAMLPDLLYQAAAKMQIRNYLKAPWYLKLRLHGYNEIGDIVEVGSGWTWKLILIDVQSQINEGGSIHTITALPMAEVALNNQYCMLPASATTKNATTVGEALQNVIASMNSDIVDRYGASSPPFIEYAIEDMPYPYDTKVGVTKPFDHKLISSIPQLGNQKNSVTYDGENGQFSPGTDIPALVDMLMAKSETATKMLRPSRELPPETGTDDEKVIKDVTSILHRVDTKVEYKDYDPISGDYCKKITYVIRPYSSLRLLTSMGRAQQFDKGNFNTKKADVAVTRHFMKKQYDYIFTGMNTEIVKFDINVNFRWSASVPVMQGWRYNGTPARVDNAKSALDHQAQLNSLNSAVQGKDAEIKKLEEEITAEDQQEAKAKKRAEMIAERDALKKQATEVSTVLGQEKTALIEADRKKRELARKSLPQKPVTDGEDYVYENARSGGEGNIFGGAHGGAASYLPITINQDADDPALLTRTGTPNDNSATKSVYGSLLNQAYGSFDANLVNLDLEIKGDPYWLGPGSDGEIYTEDSADDKPNFMNGEHMFVFRFKLPLGYDSITGTVSVDAEDGNAAKGESGASGNIFTGFYSTISVINRFAEGSFTQTLSAVRIPGWQYENIIEGRETVPDDVSYDNSPGPSSPTTNSRNQSSGGTVSNIKMDQTTLLALTLMKEAGGEGRNGMIAVGNVIMNRARIGYRGNSITSVITAPKQFSCWNDEDPDDYLRKLNSSPSGSAKKRQFEEAYRIASRIASGAERDITGGATSYHATYVRPNWADPSKRTTQIGKHVFYKGV